MLMPRLALSPVRAPKNPSAMPFGHVAPLPMGETAAPAADDPGAVDGAALAAVVAVVVAEVLLLLSPPQAAPTSASPRTSALVRRSVVLTISVGSLPACTDDIVRGRERGEVTGSPAVGQGFAVVAGKLSRG